MIALPAARRLAVLIALIAFSVALAFAAGAFSVTGSGHGTASPRWNKATSVAGSSVLAKPLSPRWN
jgi:hypothetical protein